MLGRNSSLAKTQPNNSGKNANIAEFDAVPHMCLKTAERNLCFQAIIKYSLNKISINFDLVLVMHQTVYQWHPRGRSPHTAVPKPVNSVELHSFRQKSPQAIEVLSACALLSKVRIKDRSVAD